MQAARGVQAALDALAGRKEAGDKGATPYHPSPSALRAVAQIATTLHAATQGGDEAEDLLALLEQDPGALVRRLIDATEKA